MKVIVVSVCLLFLLAISGSSATRRVMPWMCLERCNHSYAQILDELKQINDNRDVINAVAFEEFNLGEGCTLVKNDLAPVGPLLAHSGFETYAMISSFPYPESFLDWMRQCFAEPDSFIVHAVQTAIQEGFTGYNVDFEPHTPATPEDAANYAKFMDRFAKALHAAGKKLTMAAATWNPIWDFRLLGKTDVDRIMTMSTYTGNLTSFTNQFKRAVEQIPLNKLGIGMQIDLPKSLPANEIKARFDMCEQYGIEEIDLWQSPIPQDWLPFVRAFGLGKK